MRVRHVDDRASPFADMALIDTGMMVLHLVVAGIWTGSVVYVTLAVLPPARTGTTTPESLRHTTRPLQSITRGSSLLLLITGGHLAGSFYTVERLTGTGRGHLVLTMVILWFVLTILVEIGTKKLLNGDDDRVSGPANAARPYFLTATVVAVLLLIDGGLLASGFG